MEARRAHSERGESTCHVFASVSVHDVHLQLMASPPENSRVPLTQKPLHHCQRQSDPIPPFESMGRRGHDLMTVFHFKGSLSTEYLMEASTKSLEGYGPNMGRWD